MEPKQDKPIDWSHFLTMVTLILGGLCFWGLLISVTCKLAM